ncbi:hypothetical protein Salpa_1029 [Sporomusa sp. KB1]|nr:hypothetical protein Salpa_1029 [Sporomusa sp. KB1]
MLSERKDGYRVNVGDPSADYVSKQDCEIVGADSRAYFGDVDSVPDDEWIDAEMEDGADYLLQYAVQGETIYYRLLGDNDDVVEHGTISTTVLALLGKANLFYLESRI